MTLKQLEYVDMVAKTGNISDAAGKLFIAQPSLTKALKELEEEIGFLIFHRTNKGVSVSREGEEFLTYARQVLEQTGLLKERFLGEQRQSPRFSVSCQHYSFAINAFVDVIKEFDADEYDFTLRETQTYEIIEDIAGTKSEIGIIYLSKHNEEVLGKLIKKNDLEFEELLVARPHIFIGKDHPLKDKPVVCIEDLDDYPYLSFEQGDYNSFYFSEEILSILDRKKNIKVRDRATLFNLMIGLHGYTVSSGIISAELNGGNIIAKPLKADENMRIGTLRNRKMSLSRYGEKYIEALKKYIADTK